MHKKFYSCFLWIVATFAVSIFSSCSVFAASDGSLDTVFFGPISEDSGECGVFMVLNLVIDILTYGVGILAVIGISITGIIYLTAKGNEQQVEKAKKRIFEIVIGLAVYAVLYSGLNFLLPGGKLNSGDCSVSSNNSSGSSSGSSSSANKPDKGKTKSVKSSSSSSKNKLSGKTEYRKKINNGPFSLNVGGAKNIKYKSSNSRVAYVTKKGEVYPNDVGSAVIVASSGKKKLKIKIKIVSRKGKPTIGEAASGKGTGYGDQSGSEVKTRGWYKNSSYADWNYLFRFKDPIKAEKAADAMIAACNNNKIGYENGTKEKSMSFTYELRRANWKVNKIKNNCATACSQMVLTIVQAAGIKRDGKYRDWPYKNAINGARALKNDSKDFYTITKDEYTKKWNRLKRGDILVDTSGDRRHMLMVVK